MGFDTKVTAFLIGAILIGALLPVGIDYLGSKGLGNTTTHPDTPTWASSVFIIIGVVGVLIMFYKYIAGKD